MDAIISGRAGKGLLIVDGTFMSFDVGVPDALLPIQSLNLQFFFGGALDLQVLRGIDAPSASIFLKEAYNCACALDLILITFDPTLSEHVRIEASKALEELLPHQYVIEHLENVLYGRPLPSAANVSTILASTRITNAPLVNSFLNRVLGYQQVIREVSLAWDAIPTLLFESEEKRAEFQQIAIRQGLFRNLVKRDSFRRNINPSRLIDSLADSVRSIPKHEKVLRQWAENLLQLSGTIKSEPEAQIPSTVPFEKKDKLATQSFDEQGRDYEGFSSGETDIHESEFVDFDGALEKWEHWPASTISHHGEACCRVAREWVFSIDYAQLGGASMLTGPRWLRHRYPWGPSRWPIHWCEAVRQKSLDCGALAALSHEVFTARGVRSFPAQFIQQFTEEATRDWQSRWAEEQTPAEWIREDLIYHEGCAVVAAGQEIKVWDPSAGWWINPKQVGGCYGALLAIRIFDAQAEPGTAYRWGTHLITPNQWYKLKRNTGHSGRANITKSAKQQGG